MALIYLSKGDAIISFFSLSVLYMYIFVFVYVFVSNNNYNNSNKLAALLSWF